MERPTMRAFVTDLLGKTLMVLTAREYNSASWRQLGTGVVRACALADGKLTVTLEIVDGYGSSNGRKAATTSCSGTRVGRSRRASTNC